MNTRVSFLLLALLVGVCGAARCEEEPHGVPEPVLTVVERCFPQGATTIRLLPEVLLNGGILPDRFIPFPSHNAEKTPTISADGKRLFFLQEWFGDGEWQSYFVDLTTGQLNLAHMPGKQRVKFDGKPLPFIDMGVWDPVEPAYLYVRIPEGVTDGRVEYSVWRMNIETLVATPILPPGADELCDITPDGRYLLFNRRDEEGRQLSLYSLETHTWTPLPADMTDAMRTYAPNGELVAGAITAQERKTVLAIRDVAPARLAHVFNTLALPHGKDPSIVGAPTWLFNSAGLLVNIRSTEQIFDIPDIPDITENTIWQVGVNGEASPIASGVAVIANSQNGRYWLLQQEKYCWQHWAADFYVIAVDDTAPL